MKKVIAAVLMCSVMSAQAYPSKVKKGPYFACSSVETFTKARDLFRSGDGDAFAAYAIEQQCLPLGLMDGVTVNIQRGSVDDGMVLVRLTGDPTDYWIDVEAVEME